MRPETLADVVGQKHLLADGSPLKSLASTAAQGTKASVILWGPPGTGKTTIAKAVANSSNSSFVELSAITAGVKDVRSVMQKALNDRDLYGVNTVLFLDEIHRFTKAQQDALLPGVENGWVTLIAATTENPSFSVISPLLSRSLLLTLLPLEHADIVELINRAISSKRGLDSRVVLAPEAIEMIARLASGDARRALTSLEAASQIALAQAEEALADALDDQSTPPAAVNAEHVAAAVDKALLRYDRNADEHYDVISAFIKSMRGSDPDAAVYYLARMIEAGEDPRFIARRLIIHAAEDVGLADPQALVVAVAAADAAALIGLPEARIPLAEATIYIATAPKSNAAYMAIDVAIADVRRGMTAPVPKHLRDSSYAGAKALGHGRGYLYPHDSKLGVVRQGYLPAEIADRTYYDPSDHGQEKEVSARLAKIRRIQKPLPQSAESLPQSARPEN